jgi:ferric enterobactin receptor
MKTYIQIICLLIGFAGLLYTNPVSAQTTEYNIQGTIADSVTKKPLDYITINFKVNNETVRTTLSQKGGVFGFDKLKPAIYQLVIVGVGYKVSAVNFTIIDKSLKLDTIYLSEEIRNLKQVTITAGRPIVKQLTDRIIYDMQADPESKGNNALTMMRKIPFLSLDANNNLLLKGNASFKVLINGKQSGMADNNLKAILQSMPASTIQNIEVITNPPAKYDAEGMAGVINIITNKNVGNGFKGTLNINESFPAGGPGAGTSFSVKQGKFGATGYGGASIENSPLTNYTNIRNSFGANITNLTQTGANRSKNHSGYFGTELSYVIDTLNLLSAEFNVNGGQGDGENNRISLLGSQANILEAYELDNNNRSNNKGIDAGLNYQMGFEADKKKLLTFSYRYYNYENSQFNDIEIINRVNFATPNYRQDNKTQNREQTLQVDYVQQVGKLYVEGGAKAIFRYNESDFRYLGLNESNGNYELNTAFSDMFNYNQNVLGAYNSYRYNAGSWGFSGGVRVEQTNIGADFISSQSKVDQSFFNVIPNISINKEFKDRSSLSFGFNQRIKRPNIRRLNPFVDRSNPNFETSGNPNLRPVLNNNMQLGYNNSKKLSLTIALGYSFINNIDLRITTFDAATNITRTTYQNTGKASRLGLDYNLNYPFTSAWNISLNGNVEHIKIAGLVSATMIEKNLVSGYLSASTGYRFDGGWRVNGNITYRSRAIADLQSTSNKFINTSISVNKELIKNKLSFAGVINNPFAKYRYNITNTIGPDFTQVSNIQQYFRQFNLSLNYNFGRLKDDVKKSQRGINNDDNGI